MLPDAAALLELMKFLLPDTVAASLLMVLPLDVLVAFDLRDGALTLPFVALLDDTAVRVPTAERPFLSRVCDETVVEVAIINPATKKAFAAMSLNTVFIVVSFLVVVCKNVSFPSLFC